MGTTDTEKKAPKPNGGLYSRVNVSVKTINIVIAVGLAALIVVLAFVVTHNGFTITFDTDGGSRVASVVGKYGETIAEPETPGQGGLDLHGLVQRLRVHGALGFRQGYTDRRYDSLRRLGSQKLITQKKKKKRRMETARSGIDASVSVFIFQSYVTFFRSGFRSSP